MPRAAQSCASERGASVLSARVPSGSLSTRSGKRFAAPDFLVSCCRQEVWNRTMPAWYTLEGRRTVDYYLRSVWEGIWVRLMVIEEVSL